jgi:glutaredoxin/glutathione-dependent peroxiredoxin
LVILPIVLLSSLLSFSLDFIFHFFVISFHFIALLLYYIYLSPFSFPFFFLYSSFIMSEIKVGDSVPEATLFRMGDNGPEPVKTSEYFKDKTVALFGVPGAFTPTCHAQHVPSFIDNAAAFAEKKVEICCVAVNDPFVLKSWSSDLKADAILFLSDGNAEFAKATGLDTDISVAGLGIRGKRFGAIVKNGKFTYVGVEDGKNFELSSGSNLLKHLDD